MPNSLQAQVDAMHRRVIQVERVRLLASLAAAALLVLATVVAIDALVRWPALMRCIALVAGLAVFVRAARIIARRGWLDVPRASSTALRLEHVEPSLHGLLASAYEFERSGEATRNALAADVVLRATDRWNALTPRRHVRHGSAAAWAGLAGALALAWLGFAFLQPIDAFTGLRRTLTPWTADQWPARVALESEMTAGAVARGSSVALRVRVTRGDEQGIRVRAVCESRASGSAPAVEREFELARQADGSFERPVVAEGSAMRVRFMAGDGETEPIDLQVVAPPAIERGALHIEPPSYAASDHPTLNTSWQGVSMPDPGPVLAGSQVTLQLDLGAPAPEIMEQGVQAFDDRGQPTAPPGVTIESPTRWRVNWVAERSVDVVIRPTDPQGVQAPEALRVGLRVTPDNEPTVSVTEPDADEAVTPEAVVPFRVESRDDLGLASIGWRLDRQQRSGESAPVLLREVSRPSTLREETLVDQLSLGAMQAKVGDTLLLRGLAKDRMDRDGPTRGVVLSDARKLRVMEREAFERQVRQQTAALRQAAARLEASQQEIAREQDAAAASRSEAGLVERVHQGNESARRLVQRLKRNGLQDLPLTETLQEASRLGDQAEREATRAQDELRRSAQGEASAMNRAREAQKAAESALRDMVDLLDRDDDAAAAQRRADRLAEGIAKLREDLRKAAQPAAGKSPEELSPQERQAMQEQSARQRAAADEAAAMVDDLRARAERVESKDRTQAKSLRQAAEEGERGQASRRMDEAADRTDRNQATAADEAMKAAAEAVDRMREALREDRRARTEDLKRRLASLAESLQALIRHAEEVVPALETAGEASATALLQISRNTAAAAEEAKAGDRSLQKVAGLIERAGERFDAAVSPLRAQPADAAASRDAITRGIDLLREALKGVQEAQQREQEKAAERERAQLEKQYRELAAQTRSIREATAGTLPPVGGRVDRRGAAVQREQAQRVQGVQQAFDSGPKSIDSVKEAATFVAVHARIDKDLGAARVALEGMQADGGTVRRLDLVVEAFEALAAALATPEEPDDPFADAARQAGEAGGAGGGDGKQENKLPPIAELKLVRQLQQQVLQLTRTLDEARSAGTVVDAELRDLAAMQDEVRRLGEDWIRRMEATNAARKGIKRKENAPRPPTDAYSRIFGMDDGGVKDTGTSKPVEGAPSTTPPPATEPASPAPRTLDELLGIAGGGGADEAARMQRERQLKRSLNEEDLDDLAKAATESMDLASSLVRDRKETGLGTQRVQRQAVESLDALIDAATRFNKQQQQQKGSKSQSQGKRSSSSDSGEAQSEKAGEPKPGGEQQGQRKDGGQRNPQGTTGEQVEPPPPEDAAMAAHGTLVEGRSEWGRLPQRIREIMSQARRDRISAIYQQATEAYYRRMAEERSP